MCIINISVIVYCFLFQISISDKISNCLCKKCFQLLEISYNFRIQCLLSEQKLKDFLQLENTKSNNFTSNGDFEIKKENDHTVDYLKAEENNFFTNQESEVGTKDEEVKIEKSDLKSDDDSNHSDNNDDAYCDDDDEPLATKKFGKKSDKPSSFKCRVCEHNFSSYSKYKKHVRADHEQSVYKCDECSKVFIMLWRLEKHQLTHGFNCKTCFKKFENETDLKKHTEEHSEHGRFVCKDCGKEFSKKFSLVLHMRVCHLFFILCFCR